MHRTKHIAIILLDTLQSTGLQSLLADYFPPVEISSFSSFDDFSAAVNDAFDYYFIQPDTFVLNADFFLPRRSKTILLIEDTEKPGAPSSLNRLTVRSPQETLIEQLQAFFTTDNGASSSNPTGEGGNKELSSRETDVLQLIVKGITNKEIADKLNISLNTVLTHRKNITAKLGIKTVSGLTFYAIMNGLISGDDIEL